MTHRETTEPGAPCWIEIMTSDQEGARAFYGDLFGWTSTEPQEEFGGYLNFAKDGRLVAGCMGKTPDMADGPDVWSVYVATEDAKAVADAAAAHGGQVIAPPMQVADLGTMAVVADPAGAVIGAWQPGTHPGFGVVQEPGAPGWFELHTRDYETSVDFHRQVFGWTTT
ncbi:MAG TPA: VOC family protein, partial [Acidimicrobiales bacterium]